MFNDYLKRLLDETVAGSTQAYADFQKYCYSQMSSLFRGEVDQLFLLYIANKISLANCAEAALINALSIYQKCSNNFCYFRLLELIKLKPMKTPQETYQLALAFMMSITHDKQRKEDCDREAVNLFKQAIAAGIKGALYHLAWMYVQGQVIEEGRSQKDYDREAVSLYKQAIGAGGKEALYNLALMYMQGRAIEEGRSQKDYDREAVSLYKQAIGAGSKEALYNLAGMYVRGRVIEEGRSQNDYDREAVNLYKQAIAVGINKANYNLAWMYKQGRVIEEGRSQNDYDREAVNLYKQAIAAGSKGARYYKMALYNLALMYAQGRVIEEGRSQNDYDREAVSHLKQAIAAGVKEALCNLALMYERGRVIEEGRSQNDYDREAVNLLKQAIAAGVEEAHYYLAEMYAQGKVDDGRSVAEHQQEAIRLRNLNNNNVPPPQQDIRRFVSGGVSQSATMALLPVSSNSILAGLQEKNKALRLQLAAVLEQQKSTQAQVEQLVTTTARLTQALGSLAPIDHSPLAANISPVVSCSMMAPATNGIHNEEVAIVREVVAPPLVTLSNFAATVKRENTQEDNGSSVLAKRANVN